MSNQRTIDLNLRKVHFSCFEDEPLNWYKVASLFYARREGANIPPVWVFKASSRHYGLIPTREDDEIPGLGDGGHHRSATCFIGGVDLPAIISKEPVDFTRNPSISLHTLSYEKERDVFDDWRSVRKHYRDVTPREVKSVMRAYDVLLKTFRPVPEDFNNCSNCIQ